ncbi:MAG: tetratricopeptide repeat protein [Gammaproteobacteria bacterium]|nr:tetratricopeptide repeat protein [Gammaproteobacteria bacterium]MCP5136856.1 tetratricopeptide repeat protein [Gammaproteobacteria bacterium]
MFMQNRLLILSLLWLVLGGCTATQTKPETETPGSDTASRLVDLGDGVVARGEPETALAIFDRALANSPNHRGALLGKGQALTALGRHAEAETVLRQARDIYPHSGLVLSAYARLLIESGRAEVAVGELDGYFMAHPAADAGLWNLKGLALDALSRHGEAEQAYTQGLARSPQSVSLRNNLAYCLILQGDYARAADLLQRLVDGEGGQPRHRQNLALAYGLVGNQERAREVARLDLQGDAVERNLNYYQWLRDLPAPTRYQALLRRP